MDESGLAPTWRRDPRLGVAVFAAVLAHGGMLLAGSYRRTYDAYVHIFFADHYARDWFSTWEPRWYTGFTVTSYPPGTHQLVAALSRFVGLETGFALVQVLAIVALVVGVYRFAGCWVDAESAGWAAVLTAASSSLAEAVHVFGQLPTTASLGLLLNAQPSVRRWVHDGQRADLLAAVALLAATTASHHVTTLFGSVFFTGPIVVRAVLDRWQEPLAGEPAGHPGRVDRRLLWPVVARRLRRVGPALWRLSALGAMTIGTLVFVVLPYWLWSSSDPITQVPIPHGSRGNYLSDLNAGLVFWLIPWSGLLIMAPYAIMRGLWSRRWPLAASVALLLVLGTGGTTPIPRLLLGGAFDILTLDRFTIWATVAILPLAGLFVTSLRQGGIAVWLRNNLGVVAAPALRTVVVVTVLTSALFAANLSQLRPLQPDAIDPAPIAGFMSKDQHDRWRYLTLGFGDQMAWVSANTTALTVDGNYHSARRLPELISRPVERLEGAKFRGIPGIGSLQQFLGHPARYHLKWVFSADAFYDPLLWASGWHRLDALSNGVTVWERPDVPPLPTLLPSREIAAWQRLLWGVLPMSALLGGAVALGWVGLGRPLPRVAQRALVARPRAGRRWASIDARLVTSTLRLGDGGERRRWARRRILGDRVAAALARRPSRRRVRVQQAMAVVAIAAACSSLVAADWNEPAGPDEVVVAFYDDLDSQRYDAAWEKLDPRQREDRETFLLARSVRDGLREGYSELDDVEIVGVAPLSPDTTRVSVSLSYVTSLSEYRSEETHDLVRRDGRWYLVPAPIDPTIPPEPFVRRASVDYLSQGRRQVTSGRTAYADVLDRPRVRLGEARLLRWQDRWVVVGDVTNEDVDPAHVTIEAVLRDADGQELAVYEATQVTVHKVLPLETVPFRVEIEGRAGTEDLADPAAGSFRPDAFTQPILDGEVASVELSARAVVSGESLDRSLSVQELRVVSDDSEPTTFGGELRNDGLDMATVPHVLVTLLDGDGSVAWVDHLWIADGVRAQRTVPFELTLTDPSELEEVDVPIRRFDNALPQVGEPPAPAGLVLPLPADGGYEALRIDVVSFHRSDRS